MIELKLTADTVSQLKQQLANLLKDYEDVTVAAKQATISGAEPAKAAKQVDKKAKKAEEPTTEVKEEPEETPAVSYDEAKKKATEVARKGAEYRDKVKAILKGYEVVRISDLPKESVGEFMAAIEAL